HGMQEVGRPPSMPSPTRVPRCLDRPSLLARVSRPLIVARPSHSGLVTRTLAWLPAPWLGLLVPWLGLLVPWLGFILPRLGFSNVGLVSPHVVAFLARASAKRCAYLKNYDR